VGKQVAQQSRSVAAPTPLVLSASEAIARTERAIVGDALTRDPAVAEGLVLAGVRAASLALHEPVAPEGRLRGAGTSCVHHVGAAPGCASGGAFEIAASSAQEAVDHCLAAHLLSRRLGRSGVCSLTPSLASELSLVHVPESSDLTDRNVPEAVVRAGGVDSHQILDVARNVFASVSERVGRPVTLVRTEGEPDATLVLLAAGAAAASARAAVQALAGAGIPARIVILTLLRPFPNAEVRKALTGARLACVVGECADSVEYLLTSVRAIVEEKADIRAVVGEDSADLVRSLFDVLPDCGFDVAPPALSEAAPFEHHMLSAPETPWGDATLRLTMALLARRGPLELDRRTQRRGGATMLSWSGGAVAHEASDLLLLSQPAALQATGLALLRPRSSVVVLSDATSSAGLAKQLSPVARASLREGEHRLYWVAPPEEAAPDPGRADGIAARQLAGAALAAMTHPNDPAAAADEGEPEPWLSASAKAVRELSPADLAADLPAEEIDFRESPKLPRMPETVDDADARAAWARWLRAFHGAGALADEFAPVRPLRPAVLASLAEEMKHTSSLPFVLFSEGDGETPVAARGLTELLRDGIDDLVASGRNARGLSDNLAAFAAEAERVLAPRESGAPLDEVLAAARAPFTQRLGLSEADAHGVIEDIDALRASLPAAARVFDLRTETPLRVYREVLAAIREPLERGFSEQLGQLREKLRDRLRLDHMSSDAGRSPEALVSELGGTAVQHLDLDALARTLPRDPSGAQLDDLHRQRLEQSLNTIERHLRGEEKPPRAVFLHTPDVSLRLDDEPYCEHPDPLAAAIGYFDGVARQLTALFRAVRIARLEVEGSYRPALHDEVLERLDWEAFSDEELALLPVVTVVTTGRQLRQRAQSSLSELLRSSRPVRVLVSDEVAAPDEAYDLSLFHIDLGHLVMAHREAFAISSSLVRPRPVIERLVKMLREPRPGVVFVPLPADAPAPWRPLLAEAALQGRACSEFHYDPDAGLSWADRVDVTGNPQPECAWPLHRIAYTEDGVEQSLETAFTFADAVALEPAYLRHLRVIPRVAWQDDVQIPLADFIARFDPSKRAREIPFIWVIDDGATLQRAVVTRELALACRDRLRSWRVLQELGGFENAYADRAAVAAREAARQEAARERAELEQAQAEALASARGDGAREAMQKLAATLLGRDPLAAAAPVGQAAVPAAPRPATPASEEPLAAAPEPAPPSPAEEEEPELSFDDPYIDSPLCTSCNECTNINSRLFHYNENKQAFIADPTAGSFAELVKAAGLCPARCIHPGKPRSDDNTATPELIARAAEFN